MNAWKTIVVAVCLLSAVPGEVLFGQDSCSFRPDTQVLRLFPRKAGDALTLDISVGGGKWRRVLIDTGSTGIAIPKSLIGPGAKPVKQDRPPTITYTSDDVELKGSWVKAPVQIRGVTGSVTTVPVVVLAIDTHCKDGNCHPLTAAETASIGMMGVGFDRDTGTTVDNPFLNVKAMVGSAPTMQRGYIITTTQIQLGMRATDVEGFQFVPLDQYQDGASKSAVGCITVSGPALDKTYGPVCGPTLVDTGIDYMIVSAAPSTRPQMQSDAGCPLQFPAGTKIHLQWPQTGAPAKTFAFTTPGCGQWPREQPVPAYVRWAQQHQQDPVFVNTGRQLLQGADYLFDATCHRIGFRPRTPLFALRDDGVITSVSGCPNIPAGQTIDPKALPEIDAQAGVLSTTLTVTGNNSKTRAGCCTSARCR